MPRSLNHKIFRLVAGLLICTSVAILLAVWTTTTAHVRKQAQSNLSVAQSVLRQVLESSEKQLIISADVLTADFGFKQAVAGQDIATVSSALSNHGRRISADLMALISLEGKVLSSTDDVIRQGEDFPAPSLIKTVLEQGGAASFLQFNGRLYQSILLTVDTPTPSAIALVGFEINREFVSSLENIVNLSLTIVAKEGDIPPLLIGTLADDKLADVIRQGDRNLNYWWLPFASENTILSQRFDLFQLQRQHVFVVLSQDLDSLISQFKKLQLQITIISLVSMCIALALVIIFSKKLTQPLSRLARAARSIADGNYDKEIVQSFDTRETSDLVVAFQRMQNNIKTREQEIDYRANHDVLTGLHNRFWISNTLDEKLRVKQDYQAVLMDVINFRGVNDTFGYHNGDAYLKSLAARLHALGGDSARMSGGELLWLPPQKMSLIQLAEAKEALEREHAIGDTLIHNKLAVGMINIPEDAKDAETVFRRLSITLEHAKADASLVCAYRQELEAKYLARLQTVGDLRRILTEDQNELNMYYQPKLRLQDRQVPRLEALIRWHSATKGFVSPDCFIPLAEQAGLIKPLTLWVIRRVIADLSEWRRRGAKLQVAINLSMQDINSESLLPAIVRQLDEAGLAHDALAFEITESEIMRDPQSSLEQLYKFREAGFQLAIDDFGTGYSSLSYLKTMPISELKIDKSFVLALDRQTDDQRIVQTIISLAHQFELEVVAEGVEQDAALSLLQSWSCDWIQGYFIAKPMPAGQVLAWLDGSKSASWATSSQLDASVSQ